MSCPNMKFWAELVHDENSIHKTAKLPCRRWSCPECAKDNARKLRLSIRAGVERWFADRELTQAKLGYQAKLVTLTLPGGEWRQSRSLAEMEKESKKKLNRLLQNLRKARDLDAYLWVREVKGEKHLHYHLLVMGPGIADRDILAYIRRLWTDRYGMGNVDIQVVKTLQGAVSYVTKYVTKGDGEQKISNGKHFGISAALRSTVILEREEKRKLWTVVRIGVLNGDGSFGKVMWEAPGELPPEPAWVKEFLSLREPDLGLGRVIKGTQLKIWD